MLTQTYDLSIMPNHSIVKVHTSQWDSGERQFVFNLYGESSPYTIPTGSTVEIKATKADGHGFAISTSTNPSDISYSGSAVTIKTTKQMTAAAGEQDFKITVISGAKVIASARYTLVVDEDVLSSDTDVSDSEIPAIIELAEEQLRQATQQAQLSKSYAQGHSESGRENENTDNSKYYKEQAEASATAAGTSATSALNSANAAATSESNAAASAGAASDDADEARAQADRAASYSVNVPYIGNNGNWWVWNTTQGAYVDSGVDASITLDIADITMLEPTATPYVTNTGTNTDPIFHLFIPRGKGIASVTKTSTSGLVDTYTITYSDGATTTFTVTNGKTAYQSAVEGGYSGTEAEFEDDLAHFEEWADDAETAASNAASSESNAADSANDAQSYANDAQEAAAQAASYAGLVIPTFYIDFSTMELMQRDTPTAADVVFSLDANKHLLYEIQMA